MSPFTKSAHQWCVTLSSICQALDWRCRNTSGTSLLSVISESGLTYSLINTNQCVKCNDRNLWTAARGESELCRDAWWGQEYFPPKDGILARFWRKHLKLGLERREGIWTCRIIWCTKTQSMSGTTVGNLKLSRSTGILRRRRDGRQWNWRNKARLWRYIMVRSFNL